MVCIDSLWFLWFAMICYGLYVLLWFAMRCHALPCVAMLRPKERAGPPLHRYRCLTLASASDPTSPIRCSCRCHAICMRRDWPLDKTHISWWPLPFSYVFEHLLKGRVYKSKTNIKIRSMFTFFVILAILCRICAALSWSLVCRPLQKQESDSEPSGTPLGLWGHQVLSG